MGGRPTVDARLRLSHEIVYKRLLGRQEEDSETQTSKYNDGKIGIHKLPIRGQHTVLKRSRRSCRASCLF
jgi:hypothetical protein